MSQPPNLNRQDYGIQDFFLQYISSNFVSVKDADKKFYKFHLEHVVSYYENFVSSNEVAFVTLIAFLIFRLEP